MRIALLILVLVGFNQASAQQLTLRTDGYYFYDNGLDTIYVSRLQAHEKKMLTAANFPLKGSDCVPAGTISVYGSATIELLGFTKNRKGARFTDNCADTPSIKSFINNLADYNRGKTNNLEAIGIDNVVVGKDNTFTATVGQGIHAFKRITGKIFLDRIELKYSYTPPYNVADDKSAKVFRFYRFNELPPLRKNLKIKYKSSFE